MIECSDPGEAYFRKLQEGTAFGANGFDLDQLRECMQGRREPTVPGTVCSAVRVEGMPAEWVVAPGADSAVRMLYLHGGGYISGSGSFYLALAAHLSAAAKCAVLLIDYRLAPEHPFPAGIEDCVVAHGWMCEHGPDGAGHARATFIAGDSAGGGLTLATIQVLRDRHERLPAGAIGLSAFADLTLSGESIISEGEQDPIMHPACLPRFVELYAGGASLHDPLASPVFGDYAGCPPLLLQVGEHEVIRDDSVRVAAQATAAGVPVELEVYAGMFHVFPSHEPLLPEGRMAIESIGRFVRSLSR